MRVVRLAAKSREAISTDVDFLTLHEQVREYAAAAQPELHRLLERKRDGHELSAREEKRLRGLRRIVERQLLRAAQVISFDFEFDFLFQFFFLFENVILIGFLFYFHIVFFLLGCCLYLLGCWRSSTCWLYFSKIIA